MNRKHDVILRSIHGAYFLIDITDHYNGDKCAIYEINETGKFLWEALEEPHSIDELATLLSNAIIDDVDHEIIYRDVNEFVLALKKNGFVEDGDHE